MTTNEATPEAQPQLTRADLDSMTREQKVIARRAGQMRDVLGTTGQRPAPTIEALPADHPSTAEPNRTTVRPLSKPVDNPVRNPVDKGGRGESCPQGGRPAPYAR